MAISATLQRVEHVIDDLVGRDLTPLDAHPALLAIAEILGGRPYAVIGPGARFRWRLDGQMVEAGVDRFRGAWELGYRAFPYEPDVSRGEYLAFAYGADDLTPPYEWSLELHGPQPRLPQACPLAGWQRVATELGYLVGKLPEDLAAVPPSWFDGTVTLSTDLGGVHVRAAADRHGLTLVGPDGVTIRWNVEQAQRAGSAIGAAWAWAYAGRAAGDLVITVTSGARPFTLLTAPGGSGDEPPQLPAFSFDDLRALPAPGPGLAAVPEPVKPFLAAYVTVEHAADLVREVVHEGVSAFLRHHELTAGGRRPGVPDLRAKAGWRARVLSGTILLTLVESHDHAEEVLAYAHRLLELLEETFGVPWGSSRDSQGRLSRTWRTGDLALRAGSSGSSVVVEITSYADLLTYHFG